MSLTEQEINGLKKVVLDDQIGFLCEELGDPGRYFPYLRSKRMLSAEDCQTIRDQRSLRDQVQVLVEVLKERQSSKAFDVLVDALKKQRVQAHIARALLKALAKAKEEAITPNGVRIRSSEVQRQETEKLSSLPYSIQQPAEDFNGREQFEIHPDYGALPPPTDDHPVSNTVVYDEQVENVHPQLGLFPTEAEGSSYAQEESSLKTAGSAYNLNGSESELGGQSQPNSMLTADSSSSSQLNANGSYSGYIEALEVLKLEAKVKDLTTQLEDAQSENRRKDAEILSLHQLLKRAGIDKNMTTSNSSTQPVRPYKLSKNGSDNQLRTIVTPSSTYSHFQGSFPSAMNSTPMSARGELQEQPQGWRENAPFSNNHFISRSKSSSPSASISFV